MQISGTTTGSGLIGTGLNISNAIVYAFRATSVYRCVPYVASDGAWNVIVLKAQATQEAVVNTSVTGTVYYI